MLCKDRGDAVASLESQKRFWHWEQIGWVLMALFLVAGLTDVLRPGPRSKRVTAPSAVLHSARGPQAPGSPVQLEIQAKGGAENDLVAQASR